MTRLTPRPTLDERHLYVASDVGFFSIGLFLWHSAGGRVIRLSPASGQFHVVEIWLPLPAFCSSVSGAMNQFCSRIVFSGHIHFLYRRFSDSVIGRA